MGRLGIKQILRVPKYIGDMVVVRSQDQLTPRDARSVAKYGSPFELNLDGWSRAEPKPTIRELVEGPLAPTGDHAGSRFGKLGTTQRLDLLRARRRAKCFTHVTTMTGGLFSNWKQVSKTMGVYRDFLQNRMDYELASRSACPIDDQFVANNVVTQRAIEEFRSKSARVTTGEIGAGSRLAKVQKRLHGLMDETKVISKERFVRLNRVLKTFPIL